MSWKDTIKKEVSEKEETPSGTSFKQEAKSGWKSTVKKEDSKKEEKEEKSGLQKILEPVSVAAQSGLRGWSLGLSEYARKKLEPEKQKEVEKLREEYPTLATVSEIGGSLIPGPGLAGNAGKVASWAGSKLLKQFPNLAKFAKTGQVTKGAVTAAGAGTGEAMIQSGLEAEEGKRIASAQDVVSFQNLLLGAGLGGVGGVFSKNKTRLANEISEDKARIPKLREKALGNVKDSKKYGKKKEDIVDLAVQEDLIPRKGLSPEEALEKTLLKETEVKNKLDSIYGDLDKELQAGGKSPGDLLSKFKEDLKDSMSRPSGDQIKPKFESIYKSMLSEVDDLITENAGKPASFSDLRNIKIKLSQEKTGNKLSEASQVNKELINRIDTFLKDTAKSYPGKASEELVKEADRLSKIILIKDQLQVVQDGVRKGEIKVNYSPSGWQIARILGGDPVGGLKVYAADKLMNKARAESVASSQKGGPGQRALDLEAKVKKGRKKLEKKPLVGEGKLSTSIQRQQARKEEDKDN